jgi:tetrahydromethanopterin S-methyltransferase subunit D
MGLIVFLITWLINSYFIAHLKTAYFDRKARKVNAIWRYSVIATLVIPVVLALVLAWFQDM